MRKTSYGFLRAVVKARHVLLVSRLVKMELHETPDLDERTHIYRRMADASPRNVPESSRVLKLRDELLREGRWGANRFEDMLHVAYTIACQADALVTWDEGDLARSRTRRVVESVCRRMGVRAPKIGIPEDVARWLNINLSKKTR